jgi:hypothetical protein
MANLTSRLAGSGVFMPTFADDGYTLIGMSIQVSVSWVDANQIVQTTTTKQFEVWHMLNDQQRTNLQDLSNTIGAGVAALL